MEVIKVFDIETTGYNNGINVPIEVACIELNAKTYEFIKSSLIYLYKDGMPWTKQAEGIHHISRKWLSQYEDVYSRNVRELYKSLYRSYVCGHNVNIFDAPFMSGWFEREGYEGFRFLDTIDTMRVYKSVFKRNVKLDELPGLLGIPESVIRRSHKHFFGCDARIEWHSASWDTTVTMLALSEARRRKLID